MSQRIDRRRFLIGSGGSLLVAADARSPGAAHRVRPDRCTSQAPGGGVSPPRPGGRAGQQRELVAAVHHRPAAARGDGTQRRAGGPGADQRRDRHAVEHRQHRAAHLGRPRRSRQRQRHLHDLCGPQRGQRQGAIARLRGGPSASLEHGPEDGHRHPGAGGALRQLGHREQRVPRSQRDARQLPEHRPGAADSRPLRLGAGRPAAATAADARPCRIGSPPGAAASSTASPRASPAFAPA